MTRVYIVRHCEAEGNINRTFQGHTDAGITEKGRLQLEKLEERFSTIHLDAVYTSDLVRAVRTAEAVLGNRDLPFIVTPELREINGGEWEGKGWAELPGLYPEACEAWTKLPHLAELPGGESMQELEARVWEALLQIARQNRDRDVAAVSHGGAIRVLMCRAKGWELSRLSEVAWCDNTAVSVVEFDDRLNPTLVMEGDDSHLTDELSTVKKQKWWKDEHEEQ